MGDTSTILACKRDRNKPCHPHACPNLFVLRAETAALLINSCEKSNDMQMLSRLDFFTKHRKYLQYNRYCLHISGYCSLSEAVTLRKREGKVYEICVHTQGWLVNIWWTTTFMAAHLTHRRYTLFQKFSKYCWENGNFWFTQSLLLETFDNNQDNSCFNREGSSSREW